MFTTLCVRADISVYAVWVVDGTALTHMELCAKFVILMVIMEQVGLFNLNKYPNMMLKTGKCTPSKKYEKPPSIVWVIQYQGLVNQ